MDLCGPTWTRSILAMPLNPRVEPSSLQASLGLNDKIQAPFTQVFGAVTFDMATDSALIAAGQSKQVLWNSQPLLEPDPASPNNVGMYPVSAFSIDYLSTQSTDIGYVFDEAAEVAVGSSATLVAWMWPASLVGSVVPFSPESMIMYEGSPISPELFVRTGMIPGVTPPDAKVTYRFQIRIFSQAIFGGARIRVPSPYCAPPFVPTGVGSGKHIFSELASNNTPRTQATPFPRLFRSLPILTDPNPGFSLDARVLGGPWRGHLQGAAIGGASTGNWTLEALLGSVDSSSYTPAVLASDGPVSAAELHSPVGQVHGGIRALLNDPVTPGATEIMLDYLGG